MIKHKRQPSLTGESHIQMVKDKKIKCEIISVESYDHWTIEIEGKKWFLILEIVGDILLTSEEMMDEIKLMTSDKTNIFYVKIINIEENIITGIIFINDDIVSINRKLI